MPKLVFRTIMYVGIEDIISFVSLRVGSESYTQWADIHFANIQPQPYPIICVMPEITPLLQGE